MRVLFISSGLGVGGAETALERLIPHLQAKRVICEVVSLREEGEVGARMMSVGITVHALGMQPPKPSLQGLLRLFRVVRHFKPDVIQGWMYHGNIAAHIARLAAPRAVVLGAVHQTLARPELDPWTTRAVIRLDALLSHLGSRTIYVAHSAAEQHVAHAYSKRAAVVLPNGFDTRRFAPDAEVRRGMRKHLGFADGDFVIGTVGRFHLVKDHAGFLKAAIEVAQRFAHVRFVMAGAGLDAGNAALAPLLTHPALQGRVAMLGARNDVPQLMQALDVFVLSSLSEGLPNVVAEAMSCAVPCVVTRVGDAPWMVADTGWVVPPGVPASLAAGMAAAVVMEPALLAQRGKAARVRVESELAISGVARRYIELYEDLVPQRAT
ncbi:glycosyltransferase [Uliginosibacterium sp. H3]|uniref:Glycosyltransferase n=1 Tax=Uliginosibacterium silvisoli TaxID=3114758 RepID=A0ABU6K9F5_9RHOO|nr:glycosyltransferase [Uliginosibacterium sp. H3]